MTQPVEVGPGELDDAWSHFSQVRDSKASLGSFTRRRIERVVTLSVAIGSIILGAQALSSALGPYQELPGWHIPLVLLSFVPLAAMLIACAVGRFAPLAAGLFALAYAVTLLLWPIATAGTVADAGSAPWVWYLVNVATVAGVLAFPLPLQVVWTVFVPLLYGVVRLIQGGFGSEFWGVVLLDVSFALILGGMLTTIGWVLRSLASNVDAERGKAVDSYAEAAAEDASEQERVTVSALMHDSVLAALIAAERADTPREQALASAMAQEALTRLANTEREAQEGSDAPTSAAAIATGIEHASHELGVTLKAEREIEHTGAVLPGRVGQALVLASTQAVANAVQHADGRGLGVNVRSTERPPRVRIEIRDTGSGFDWDDIPDDRLGIRASIVARVAAVGGTTRIRSDASGTIVRLEWRGVRP